MVGLVPTIHAWSCSAVFKTWMLAARASITEMRDRTMISQVSDADYVVYDNSKLTGFD